MIRERTTIVVPCYNEAARLEPDRFVAYCAEQPQLSLLFVDDGSKDDTFAVLGALQARVPEQISLLKLEKNSGKAEAVRRGVLQALASSAELVGFWDADLATPLYNIDRFSQLFAKPEIQLVVGSRVGLLGHEIQRTPGRHYIGRGFATLAALALQLPIYDTQCGAKLFRANATFREIFAHPFELGWSFDIELFARFARASKRNGLDPRKQVIEAPLREWIDAPGSKLRPSHFPRIAWELGKLFVIARRP
jgi:glycosyltransferase involved in cell wall biosynthesis